MSPIEHIWDTLDRQVRQQVPTPANVQQLCIAIEEEWMDIPQAAINSLINCVYGDVLCCESKWWSY